MTLVYMFPGQGSQYKGMGGELFDKFPHLVKQADAQLGYSLKELCLTNSEGLLDQTQYTQPALYSVNALSYLDAVENEELATPDYFAGHSLGEFNALFAAGAFDFISGLKMVQERGRLMATAPKGAMAAIMGMDISAVRNTLDKHGFDSIDVANYNSRHQIIISGLLDDIIRCEQIFDDASVRYVRLNVHAAFHSRYMQPVQQAFADFLTGFELKPLKVDVIANTTARPYPSIDYSDYLVKQITNSVKWYETQSWLLTRPAPKFVELGPGNVLTKLSVKIKEEPMLIKDPGEQEKKILFMYGGQGSQYYKMGMELYEHNSVFKAHMNKCDAVFQPLMQASLVEKLYQCDTTPDEFDDILYTHAALYCFGYSLTQVLLDKGIEPDAVLGYSVGEYVAATVAGIITLEDGLRMVLEQARCLKEKAPGGGMLTILCDVKHYEENPSLYNDIELASVNYQDNFVVGGSIDFLSKLKQHLDQQSIVSLLLPVQYGFHTQKIDLIEDEFKAFVADLSTNDATIPCYSCASGGRLENVDGQYWWDVVRSPVDFRSLVADMSNKTPYIYVDLSATGTMASFLKYGFDNQLDHHVTVNQFGKNLQTVNKLVAALS